MHLVWCVSAPQLWLSIANIRLVFEFAIKKSKVFYALLYNSQKNRSIALGSASCSRPESAIL